MTGNRWAAAAVLAGGLALMPGSAWAAPPLQGLVVKRVTAANTTPRPARQRHVLLPLHVSSPGAYRLQKEAAQRRYRRYEARHGSQTAGTSAFAQPRTLFFNGLNQPGLDAARACCTPPDTTGAIGPDRYLEFVNSEVAMYSRKTLESPPLAASDESAFVGTSPDLACDGQVQWDQQGQRWLYAALDCSAAEGHEELYFGWSKTPDPSGFSSGNWCRYRVETEKYLLDFPKLGHDNSQIIIGANAYDDTGSAITEEFAYVESDILMLDKPPAGVTGEEACTAAESLGLSVGEGIEFTPVPANVADASAKGYVVSLSAPPEGPQSHLLLYEVGRNGEGENVVLGATSVTVPTFEVPAPVPQPGTSYTLDSSDTRLTQAVAVTDPATGKEGIWTQHTVAGSGGGPAVVRWYELTPGASAPRQTGKVAGPGGTFAFNGAVSPASDGQNAVLFYNSGDEGHLVDLRASDRHASTAPGAMVEDLQLSKSVAADEDFSCELEPTPAACRWGDYAGASPDPLGSGVVWGTGELTSLPASLAGDPQWGSRNVAIDAAPALVPVASTSEATGLGETTATLNGTVNAGGHDTKYRFEYGTSAAYGSLTPEVDAGSAMTDQTVSATLNGLAPGTTFHYRLVATNLIGTAATLDATFTTASPPPPPPPTPTTPQTTTTTTTPQTTATRRKRCKKGFVRRGRRCVRKHRHR